MSEIPPQLTDAKGRFLPGSGRALGAGRQKGSVNKTTTKIRNAILRAFDTVGGQQYLVMVALTDPKTFCALLGRVLPAELKLSDADGSPLHIEVIQRNIIEIDPSHTNSKSIQAATRTVEV